MRIDASMNIPNCPGGYSSITARVCSTPSHITTLGLAIHGGQAYALTSSIPSTRTSSHISAILFSGDRCFVHNGGLLLIIQWGCDCVSLWINTQNGMACFRSLYSSGRRPASISATDSATVRNPRMTACTVIRYDYKSSCFMSCVIIRYYTGDAWSATSCTALCASCLTALGCNLLLPGYPARLDRANEQLRDLVPQHGPQLSPHLRR